MAAIENVNIADGVYNNIFDCISNLSIKKVGDHSLNTSAHRPRSPSIFSSKDSKNYYV